MVNKTHSDTENNKFKLDVSSLSSSKEFDELLSWLFDKSNKFCLIELRDSELGFVAEELINNLSDDSISIIRVNEWPGLIYGGDDYGGIQYCFKCNDTSRNVFLNSINSFKQLKMPEMFEDISFYSSNDELLFYSVIHDNIEYVVNLNFDVAISLQEKLCLRDSCISIDRGEY